MAFNTPAETKAYAKGRSDERKCLMGANLPPIQLQSVGVGQPGNTGQRARPHSDTRFRSFAERYVIARADKFRVGHEAEDGWNCLMDAKRVYTMIRMAGENLSPEDGGS